MYMITKRMEISACHRLSLPYESKCNNLHGHNWIVTVEVCGNLLTNGMVIDFTIIKGIVDELDHANLNEVLIVQPTAENIAEWIGREIKSWINKNYDGAEGNEHFPWVSKVTVQESEGNTAEWLPT